MISSEADHQRSERASTVRTLSPGRRFKPCDVATPSNIFDEQVIVEIIHTAHDRSYAANDEGDPEYQNSFLGAPAALRAARFVSCPTFPVAISFLFRHMRAAAARCRVERV